MQPAHSASLDYSPDKVCQEGYQQESANTANPDQEVSCQIRRVDFFLVHVKQPTSPSVWLQKLVRWPARP
jgi:hypothetical protein